jgi:hypothetical protein
MGVAIHGRAADIHAYVVRVDGFEALLLPVKGIVN